MTLDEGIVATIRKVRVADVKEGSAAFVQKEGRRHEYSGAVDKVQNNFGQPNKIADGISRLLDVWHNSFYRFGGFDRAEILQSVNAHHSELQLLRTKNIRHIKLDQRFERRIRPVFGSFLDSTAGKNSKFTRRTVTGTSKALSLLAPNLFPMCDEAISVAYKCWWVYSDFGFVEYTQFMGYMKILAEQLVDEYTRSRKAKDQDEAERLLVEEVVAYTGETKRYDKSLLKIIDEYNFSKHTKGWC